MAEVVEPRILYSADLAAGLVLGAGFDGSSEQRTLSEGGEYATTAGTAAEVSSAAVQTAYATTALTFEVNQGQAGPAADYVARGSGYGIELDGGDAALTFATSAGQRTVQLELAGAKPGAAAEGQGLLEARSNYLLGNDASRWHTGIATYGSVLYRDVYEGVDVRYYGTQRQLEYDFIVAAGADASSISLKFTGAQSVNVAGNGDLVLRVDGTNSEVRFKAPVSYQRGEWGLETVASRYEIRSDGSVGFVLGSYDHSRELVIDPVLDYATYFGGSNAETARGIATDSAGNVYVTGRTTSSAAPLAAAIGGGGGAGDIFVVKFSADLSTLIYSTRIGGTADDQGNAIAVDASGNAAVTGWTRSADFPTVAANDGAISGTQDAVIFKLNASGNALVFSTYFGGTATDSGNAVAVDAAGNVYAAGQASHDGGLINVLLGTSDNAFINKYDSAGTAVYQQKFGGLGVDGATGIAVNGSGNVYIVGNTSSTNLPVVNAYQATADVQGEGFLARLDANGSTVLYATYIGDKQEDTATAVAIDGSGKVYVVGQTRVTGGATAFAMTPGALQTTALNGVAGYLRVYDTGLSGTSSLLYSTYLGAANPTGVASANGRIIVAGQATGSDVPITAATAAQSTNPGLAMFIEVINPAGTGSADLVYGTYYGSSMTAGGVAATGSGVHVAASTGTTGLAKAGANSTAPSGQDAIVIHFTQFNAAPVLSGAENLPAIAKNSTGGPGALASDLMNTHVTDANTGALGGIAVTAVDSSNGTWQYSRNGGGSWTVIAAPSATTALLLAADAQTRVRFLPASNFAGTAGLTFRAWDRTTGIAGSTADTSTNGGTTAFSTALATAKASVNDAPITTSNAGAAAATVSLGENGTAVTTVLATDAALPPQDRFAGTLQADPQSAPVAANPAPQAGTRASVAGLRTRVETGVSEGGEQGGEGQLLAQDQVERGFSSAIVRFSAELDPSRPPQAPVLDRMGVELVTVGAQDLVLASFSGLSGSEGATLEELQGSLRSAAFVNEINRLRDDVQKDLSLDKSVTISVAGVSLGLSMVYVLWLIRGGVLMGSYLSALPAWRILDPLPVLSRVDEETEEDGEALDAVADSGGDPLRGFG